MLRGINVSSGIAFGNILMVESSEIKIEKKKIEDIEAEVLRFSEAVEKSREELNKVKEKALKDFGEDKAQIFETYLLILDDPEFIDAAISKIKDEKVNAEYAFAEIRDSFITILESMDDSYMRERAADIKDVSNRILRYLLNLNYIDLSSLESDVILAAHDLTPSETAVMDKKRVLGFLTEIGGKTSHTAIMARSLEIPAVVGVKNLTKNLKNGDYVVFNGETGEVIINPDNNTIEGYKKLKNDYEKKNKQLKVFIGKETKTLDGKHIELVSNIGTPKDLDTLIKNDAEGVGLYRTEFLYMQGESEPTEEEQFEAYKTVLEKLNPKPVVIRTLDIGGDKKLDYLKIDEEMNPFLGYRAIRLCLDKKEIFKIQLRALLRAGVYGNLKIMFPMISSLQELINAKAVLNEAKEELEKENISYSKNIEIGMMIEVPSAAIISDILAKHVDFFSIGTNDLIQYTCAVDRMNEKISHLYSQFNPAVLRLIKLVIDNAHKEGKWVGMCGEAAGDKKMIPILLGFGLDEFSMSSSSILPARRLINSLNMNEAKSLSDKVLEMQTDAEIIEFMNLNLKVES
ncbi:MAG: phosphoenolpyruvate--protein phosphotransferase [Bacillota bacterium]|nr:phosphoenolpyruvate--protein phosphotransferase [Bacillota bacterium]